MHGNSKNLTETYVKKLNFNKKDLKLTSLQKFTEIHRNLQKCGFQVL